jgi:hypothetical protein
VLMQHGVGIGLGDDCSEPLFLQQPRLPPCLPNDSPVEVIVEQVASKPLATSSIAWQSFPKMGATFPHSCTLCITLATMGAKYITCEGTMTAKFLMTPTAKHAIITHS